jgi:hypothetical protein
MEQEEKEKVHFIVDRYMDFPLHIQHSLAQPVSCGKDSSARHCLFKESTATYVTAMDTHQA